MQQQNLVLILARDLADKLATATFLVDHQGTLVYFNEGAAAILGRSFAEIGPLPMDRWSTAFGPIEMDGREPHPDELPLSVASKQRRPTHRRFRITGADGRVRDIAATAFPLFARPDEFVGAVAVFWEEHPDDRRAGGRTG